MLSVAEPDVLRLTWLTIIFYDCNKCITVKTLYNITRDNRIFNVRHKIAGNGSVSIKIPSL